MSAIEQAARALRATAGTNDLTGWLTAYNDLCAAVDAQPEPALTPRTPSWHWDASARTLHLWDAGDQPDDAQTLTGDTARRTVESLSWCVSEAIIRRPEPRAEAVCDLPMLDLGDGATTHPTCTTADPWSAS